MPERLPADTHAAGSIDISSAAFWQQPMRERDRSFAALRALPSVTFHPPIEIGSSTGGPGFWAATTHDDIQFVSRHRDPFCSGRGVGFSDIPQEYNEPFGWAPTTTWASAAVGRTSAWAPTWREPSSGPCSASCPRS